MVAGQPLAHAYADSSPGDGFEPARPGVEGVFFPRIGGMVVEARKYKADEKEFEVEATVADQIEIVVFAKPEGGQRYGKTLHRQRIALKSGSAQFTFTFDEVPEKAGIDPFRLLIDRVPSDNMKTVTVL